MKDSTKSTIVNDIKQLNSYTLESMLDVFNTTERKLTEDELAFYAELYKELESRKEHPRFDHGGNLSKQSWIAVYQKGNQMQIIEVEANSKEEAIREAEMKKPYYKLDYNYDLIDIYIYDKKYENGGNIAEQNKEMLNNQAREVDHHIDELNNVLKNKVDVEPWVVAKMERATTDLSDITHYLEGEQHKEYSKPVYATGGVIGKDITFNKWDETRQGTILELTDDGDYVVSSGLGNTLISPDDVISFNEPKAKAKRFGFFEEGGGVDNPSRQEMLDYLNMYFDYYSELRTIAVEEDNILTRRMLMSLDDEELEMAYDDAQYEIKADTQYANGGEIYHDKTRFPNKGEIVLSKDVDYDMMSFFDRTNKNLLITLKNGKKIKASVGQFYNDIIFHGDFPKEIEGANYKLQLKEFEKIEIVNQMSRGGVGDVKKYEIIDSNSSKESLNNILDAIQLVNSKGLDLKLIDKTGHYAGGYNHINSVYVNSSMDFSDLVRKFNDILYSNDIYYISIIGVYAKGGSMYGDGGGVGDDFVIFSIDDNALDTLLNDYHRSELDYEDVDGDFYYKLNKRDFDRFIDSADSKGFDVDYENSEDAVVYVVNKRMAEGGMIGQKVKHFFLEDIHGKIVAGPSTFMDLKNKGYDKDVKLETMEDDDPYKIDAENNKKSFYAVDLEGYHDGIIIMNEGDFKNASDKMVRGGYLEGREEYEGYKYKIFYNPKKGMYLVDDEIGIFKGDNNYFEKYDQAKEHAEIPIISMLSEKEDKMKEGGSINEIEPMGWKHKAKK